MAVAIGNIVPFSGVPPIDAMVQGGYWSTGSSRAITYTFYPTTVDNWSDYGKQAARALFSILETYINIDFVELEADYNPFSSNADIGLFLSGDVLASALNEPGLMGMAFFPDPAFANALGFTDRLYPTAEGDVFLESKLKWIWRGELNELNIREFQQAEQQL